MPHPVDCRCRLCQDEELYRRRAAARQFTAQTRTAEEITARLDAVTVAAAAAVGLKAVRGTGAWPIACS